MWQRLGARRIRRRAGRDAGEPLRPEDWEVVWRLHEYGFNRIVNWIFFALPRSPRCGVCGLSQYPARNPGALITPGTMFSLRYPTPASGSDCPLISTRSGPRASHASRWRCLGPEANQSNQSRIVFPRAGINGDTRALAGMGASASGTRVDCCFAPRKRSSEAAYAELPQALAGRPTRQRGASLLKRSLAPQEQQCGSLSRPVPSRR